MTVRIVTAPTTEPLTLAEAKDHLKESLIGDAPTDAAITLAIQAVRELCENDTRRALITQQWQMTLDCFPMPYLNISSASWYGPQWGSSPGPLQIQMPDAVTGYEIYLPYPPLQSVDSISYIDKFGVTQTMNVSTDIIVDKFSEPGRLLPAFGTNWPATQTQTNAIVIKFTCGYGPDATTVPACAKQWMKANIGTVYELRQSEMVVYRETLITPTFIDRLLDPIRIRRY